MVGEDLDVRRLYARRIVELWLEALDCSNQAQVFILRDELENDVTLGYVAKLLTLWKELKPKVNNRTELKDKMATFLSFEQYAKQPKLLLQDPDKLYELEEVLREILDLLKLTQFDDVRI